MKSGIYKLVWGSGHFYIGSSNDLKIRKASHLNLLKRNAHGSAIVQKTYNNYGEPDFFVLEYCIESALKQKEMEYIAAHTGDNFLLNKFKKYTPKKKRSAYQCMAKELLSATIDKPIMDKVRVIMKKERRNKSNAIEKLLQEALEGRSEIIKLKSK